MDKKYWNLPSLIFNIVETLLIIGASYLLKVKWYYILTILLTFWICRFFFKQPKHYKDWKKCLIWTLLIFSSLFILIKINIFVAVLSTIFCSYVLSGKADIKDIYMWSGKETKYQDIIDYIKYNELNDNVMQFEEKIKKQDNLAFLIYKYRFKDYLTFQEISEKLDIDTQRITEIQEKVAFSFRTYIGI